MTERKNSVVMLRNEEGGRERIDAGSPIRQPCHAITTPTLSPDGRDLAAVLATLFVTAGTTALDASD